MYYDKNTQENVLFEFTLEYEKKVEVEVSRHQTRMMMFILN